jgi:predicted RNase H-like nuclease (RuvC/YqgF family)
MAKGERKVQSDNDCSGDENGSHSDEEFESPSYDDLVKLLNKCTKIIRKTRAKNKKLELENNSLLAKYDIAQKASDELREENKIVSSKHKELKTSKKELREKHDKLEEMHNELTTSYKLLKEEYTNLKINHNNLVLSHELLSNEPHDATNNIVKINVATSCDDLIVESIEEGSSSKGKKVVEFDNYEITSSTRVRMRSSRRILKRHRPPTPLSLRILIIIMTWLLKMRCLDRRTRDSRWRWFLRSKQPMSHS